MKFQKLRLHCAGRVSTTYLKKQELNPLKTTRSIELSASTYTTYFNVQVCTTMYLTYNRIRRALVHTAATRQDRLAKAECSTVVQ